MKIFFMCTHCNQGTGYARVANNITNYLAALPDTKVVYYAFQNYKGQEITDRFIDPRIKFYDAVELDPDSPNGYGDKWIAEAIRREAPDALFIYNDLVVANAIMARIPPEIMPKKRYLYLDMVYPWHSPVQFDLLKSYDFQKIFTFLDYWTEHMVKDLGFLESQVQTVLHGVDFERFEELPQAQAKLENGFDPDDFIVLNMNRNSSRKQWPVTIAAFIAFLERNDFDPKIKLYCGCMPDREDDNGYNLLNLITTECRKRGLDEKIITNRHIFRNPKPTYLTDEQVNSIYNAADVGINTTAGEGFGLPALEHAYLNRVQIVPDCPVMREVLGDDAVFVPPVATTTEPGKYGGEIMLFDHRDFAAKLDECYKTRPTIDARGRIEERYNWDSILPALEL